MPRRLNHSAEQKYEEDVRKIYNEIMTKEMSSDELPERSNYPQENLLRNGDYVMPLGSSYRRERREIRVTNQASIFGRQQSSPDQSHDSIPLRDEGPTSSTMNPGPSCNYPTDIHPRNSWEDEEEGVTVTERKPGTSGNRKNPSSSSASSKTPLSHGSELSRKIHIKNRSMASDPAIDNEYPEYSTSSFNFDDGAGSLEREDVAENGLEIEPPLSFDESDNIFEESKRMTLNQNQDRIETPRGDQMSSNGRNDFGSDFSQNRLGSINTNFGDIIEQIERSCNLTNDDLQNLVYSSGFARHASTSRDVSDFGRTGFRTNYDDDQHENSFTAQLRRITSRGGGRINRGMRKQKAPRKELDTAQLEHLKDIMKEWSDHQEKAMNDPEFQKKFEANNEICKKLEKDRLAGFFADQGDAYDQNPALYEKDPTYLEVEKYQEELSKGGNIKFYDEQQQGYVIMKKTRTETDARKIQESNMEIMKFLYDRSSTEEMSEIDRKAYENVGELMKKNDGTRYKRGDVSVVIDLHTYNENSFPPSFSSRKLNKVNGGTNSDMGLLLRPVFIDGVAIQFVSKGFPVKNAPRGFMPFRVGKNTVKKLYTPELNLNVRPVFEVLLNFLIRGHKTKVFYPKYYQRYVTKGGISKVDDVYAFSKLVEYGLVEFCEVEDIEIRSNWFTTLKRKAELVKGIFVSTGLYNPVKNTNCFFEKVSDRILTPNFLNTPDCVMVIEPTIRYLDTQHQWKLISAEEILYYHEKDGNETTRISEQLYLETQIEQICQLCQLYPLNVMAKTCIKEILLLIVESHSSVEMPFMSEEDYQKLCSLQTC